MARDVYVLTDSDDPTRALVKSFTDESTADPLVIYRSDNSKWRHHWLKKNPQPTPGRPHIYGTRPNSFKAAAGIVDAQPTGGTFNLTGAAGGTTENIAYNASAAAMQVSIRAALTGFTSAVVSLTSIGVWEVDRVITGDVGDLTADSALLVPGGSTVNISKIQDGTASLSEKWQVRLRKAMPFLHTSGSTAFASASVTATLVQAGSATANKIYSITWNTDAVGGTVSLAVSTTGANTQTVGPIPYNATADTFVTALDRHTAIAATDVSVVQVGPGSYTVMFIGTLDLDNAPTIATASNDLVVPVGDECDIAMATVGADNILLGDTEENITYEIESSEDSAKPRTIVSVAALLKADLIPGTPGQSTGLERFAQLGDVLWTRDDITGYIGGAATALDSIATVSVSAGQFIAFTHTTDGLRIYQLLAAATVESSPTTIRPDDYNASTNQKVWQLQVHDASNITTGTLTMASGTTIQLPAGSVGTPALNFGNSSSDTNTGLYWISADTIGISTGGTLRATFNTSGITSAGQFLAPNGSGTTVAYGSTTLGGNTGIYFDTGGGGERVLIQSNGSLGFYVDGTNAFSGNAFIAPVILAQSDFQATKTITAAGTTGAQTINKPHGTVNFAAAASTLVVTNSLVNANSNVIPVVYGTDATATTCRVTKASGSFTLTLNAAATAETAVGFFVIN